MKVFIAGLLISASLASCNSSDQKKTEGDSKAATNVNPPTKKQAASVNGIKAITDGYLELKNALANDDSQGAASAADHIVQAMAAFDPSALGAGQKKVYADVKDDAREHAEHIGKNAGNIKHQREHFDTLSQDVLELVNTFGAGQQLFLEHCPMYNNNKGADWISETKEIHNPYLGKAMPDCGTVKEELKM
jgi:hypothetical protein